MRKIVLNSLPFLMVILSVTSCLKGDDTNLDTDKTNSVVQFGLTGDVVETAADYHRFFSDLGAILPGDSSKFNVNLQYAGADYAPTDITVTLEVDTDALTAYNDSAGTDFLVPSSSVYSFPSTVVIKKGTLLTQIQVAITNSADFSFNDNYALPLKITSTSNNTVVGSNFGTCIYSFSARNQYDGLYTMDGTLTDANSSSIVGNYPNDVELRTYSGNSVVMYDPVYAGTYGHIIKSGTSSSYYGNFAPIFYFDTDGNITSVSNYYSTASGNTLNRQARLDPAVINKITFASDGSVEKIDVGYYMTQGGSDRTHFVETFTYESAR